MFFFFFNDTATTEIYTLSLHDALPICEIDEGASPLPTWRVPTPAPAARGFRSADEPDGEAAGGLSGPVEQGDRKSTRLNSSHANISYAVFCLKKKKTSEFHSRHYVGCR